VWILLGTHCTSFFKRLNYASVKGTRRLQWHLWSVTNTRKSVYHLLRASLVAYPDREDVQLSAGQLARTFGVLTSCQLLELRAVFASWVYLCLQLWYWVGWIALCGNVSSTLCPFAEVFTSVCAWLFSAGSADIKRCFIRILKDNINTIFVSRVDCHIPFAFWFQYNSLSCKSKMNHCTI
jgi:hypothetical protein